MSAGTGKTVILYPHEYNLRGGDSKGSVKGVTHDGRLVNIKLRVTGNVRNTEAIPSISSFSKTTLFESKMSCLASPNNSPSNPLGILIFTDCEPEKARDPDPVYSTYYISRWAQILRNGHTPWDGTDCDLPFIGLGRLVIDRQSKAIRDAKESIAFLQQERPPEWQEAIRRNEAIIADFKAFDYFVYGYFAQKESRFDLHDQDGLVGWMNTQLGDGMTSTNKGFLIRLESKGAIIREAVAELFPIYLRTFQRPQNGSELLAYFRKLHPELDSFEDGVLRVIPMIKVAGKKIFKDSITSPSVFSRLEETYYLQGSPIVFPLAVKIDRLENRERLVNKIHLMGPSVGDPYLLSKGGEADLKYFGETQATGMDATSEGVVIRAGLSASGSLQMSTWYSPKVVQEALIPHRAQPMTLPPRGIGGEAPETPGVSSANVEPIDQTGSSKGRANVEEAIALNAVEEVDDLGALFSYQAQAAPEAEHDGDVDDDGVSVFGTSAISFDHIQVDSHPVLQALLADGATSEVAVGHENVIEQEGEFLAERSAGGDPAAPDFEIDGFELAEAILGGSTEADSEIPGDASPYGEMSHQQPSDRVSDEHLMASLEQNSADPSQGVQPQRPKGGLAKFMKERKARS